MTTKQVQIRRDTATNMALATPAAGELFYDSTNVRIGVGDGSTAGGIPHASARDVQNQKFTYPAVSGTGNAIVLTNTVPKAALAAGQGGKFKAGASNSGAVTINEDGLGVKNLKKMDNGAIAALATGDLISGGIYGYDYDGTQYLLTSTGLSNSGVTAGTYTNATVTVDAKGRVTAASSGTGATMTALAVGSIILASCTSNIAANATSAAAGLTQLIVNTSGTYVTGGSDTLSGTWKALQTITAPQGGLWQRTV